MGVATMSNKIHYLIVMPVAVPLDSKHTEVNFSPNSTDLLCLQLIQVPRSLDLVVFVSTQTITTHDNNDRTDCFTPCACVQGNHKKKKKKKNSLWHWCPSIYTPYEVETPFHEYYAMTLNFIQ